VHADIVSALPAPSVGGRPRIHVDHAARSRAYRLRKRLASPTIAPSTPADAPVESAMDTSWVFAASRSLGSEWLEFTLEVGAEVRDAEDADW
jgi:hypothetical protein